MSNENPADQITMEELESNIAEIESQVPVFQTTGNPLDLKTFVDPAQLKKDVSFDFGDLDNASRNQAQMYVHYGLQASRARAQAEKMKVAIEVLESKLYAIHREALLKAGGKATEAQVDAAVKADPRWFQGKQRMIEAKAMSDFANDAREAFAQRKDMLVQVMVDRRVEQQGELRIKAAQTEAGTVAQQRSDVLAHLANERAKGAAFATP